MADLIRFLGGARLQRCVSACGYVYCSINSSLLRSQVVESMIRNARKLS